MLAMLLVSLICAFVLLCLFVPSVRMSIMAVDESLDAHEAGLALVAARSCVLSLSKLSSSDVSVYQESHFARVALHRTWHSLSCFGIK
jgi:hypothetical protein